MSTPPPTPPIVRQPRHPPEKARFDTLPITKRRLAVGDWVNLRWSDFSARDKLYFVSRSARLTPAAGSAPCLYLAPTERTSFLELYGDKLQLDREAGITPRIEASDFLKRCFLRVTTPPDIDVADLTTGEALAALHLDLGTLYAPDPDFPRAFAQAIHDHPADVDGIIYESRHTKEPCVVIWCDKRPILRDIAFSVGPSLADRTTLSGSMATVCGEVVQVVA